MSFFSGKAKQLIFGQKQYIDFTAKEKKIVDEYQQEISKVDGLVLPNTETDLELKKLEKWVANRASKKKST